MKKLNYGFGIISLILGLGLVIASFPAGIISIGFIVGSLLVLNGLGRLWMAWQRRLVRTQGNTATGQPRPLQRQDKV